MSGVLKGVMALMLGNLFLTSSPGFAQKPVQTNVDQRVVVALRVPEAALRGWLPQPWQVDPIAAGPSKDANMLISFIDRLVNHDTDGKQFAFSPPVMQSAIWSPIMVHSTLLRQFQRGHIPV